uniref:Uncharacterized protein n=1 Tax=Myripristis murdjan TaxID=586833 RepID=A0A667ZY68_9TELE
CITEKEKEMRVGLKEFQRQGGLGVAADRVVLRLVSFPVGIPEQSFLHTTQGATRKQHVCLYSLSQHCPVSIMNLNTHVHRDTHTNTDNKRKNVKSM